MVDYFTSLLSSNHAPIIKGAIYAVLYIFLAPIAGGLLAGIDRKITAHMQKRVGPPILQPFYDVLKLLKKEKLIVNKFQNLYIVLFLIFIIFTGVLFFTGCDLLLIIFALTLACIFFVLAGYSTHSPYSFIGAERELIQMMAYEPMVIITAISMYIVTKSFSVFKIIDSQVVAVSNGGLPLIVYLPAIFLGFVYILTIKLRKSPFDLSTSHHGHQELVKGITTEFSGRTLAYVEIAHWYENIFLLGIVYLFFSFNPIVGIITTLFIYFVEIIIDNTYGRFKWQLMFKSAWVVSLSLGLINLIVLYFLFYKKIG